MTDTDSFLLKCALELIEDGVKSEAIQEQCECQMGLGILSSEDNLINNNGE